MNYILTSAFVRKFDSYSLKTQQLTFRAIERIKNYLETGQAPYGLRIKKLSKKIYEARITIALRIAFFVKDDTVKFFCLGNHDDIQRCLKQLKQLLR
ncbi:hypothetical protein KJ693_07475 [bacterium]|nr:hypothetical protein [bacterium]MBU1615138.1 hypothetical protein [bacterium]